MFCPLCQSEYREGFSECAECHVQLVTSREEAQASSVRLWKGSRQSLLDKILGALDAQSIPAHFKEIVNTSPQIAVFGIPLTPVRSTFEYEVWVLCSNFEKARAAIAEIV